MCTLCFSVLLTELRCGKIFVCTFCLGFPTLKLLCSLWARLWSPLITAQRLTLRKTLQKPFPVYASFGEFCHYSQKIQICSRADLPRPAGSGHVGNLYNSHEHANGNRNVRPEPGVEDEHWAYLISVFFIAMPCVLWFVINMTTNVKLKSAS